MMTPIVGYGQGKTYLAPFTSLSTQSGGNLALSQSQTLAIGNVSAGDGGGSGDGVSKSGGKG